MDDGVREKIIQQAMKIAMDDMPVIRAAFAKEHLGHARGPDMHEPRVDEATLAHGRARNEMTTWIIRRLFQACFVILAMTVIVFVGLHAIGNPVDILISPGSRPGRARAHHREPGTGSAAVALNMAIFFTTRRTAISDAVSRVQRAGVAVRSRNGCRRPWNSPSPPFCSRSSSACRWGLYAGLKPDGFFGRSTVMAGSILGFSIAELLGWPDAHHGVRGGTGLGCRAGRGQTETLFGVRLVVSDLGWACAHAVAGDQPVAVQHISGVAADLRAGVRETLLMDFR